MTSIPATARGVAHAALVAHEREQGAFLKELLARPDSGYQGLSPRDRALARELCYGVTRQRRTLGHLVDKRAARPVSKQDPITRNALLLGAYQLLYLEGVKAHAAVKESVDLVQGKGPRGFVNAVLRSLAALAGEAIEDAARAEVPATRLVPLPKGRLRVIALPLLPDWSPGAVGTVGAAAPSVNAQALGIALSAPDQLVKRWLAAYGPERTLRLLRAENEPPPLVVRVHRSRASLEEVEAALIAAGFPATRVEGAPLALALPPGTDAERLPGFVEGRLSVEDATAQAAVDLLGARPGERILDLCAAPGGKALAIADALGGAGGAGEVVCCDIDATRLEQLGPAGERTGLAPRLTLRPGDVLAEGGAPPGPFHRAIVDAPCSNTGVLRRRVEARWRVPKLDLAALARRQLALCEVAAAALAPGGTLVYTTCSIEEEENRGVAIAFVDRHRDYRVASERACLPGDGVGDGGYAVALVKG